MLHLRINGNHLDLDESTAITITVHNPAFDVDGAEQLYSFPFRIPWTENNISLLSSPHRLDRKGNAVFDAAMDIEGLPFEPAGTLSLKGQNFGPAGGSAVFTNGTTELLDELDGINIHEILENVPSSINPPEARWTFTIAEPPNVYNIQVGGISFGLGLSETAIMSLADVIADLVSQINAVYTDMALPGGNGTLQLRSELVELNPVDSYNAQFTLSSIITPGQASLAAFQNHVTEVNNTPVATHCFPVLNWSGFYKGNNLGTFTNLINGWWDSGHIDINPYQEPAWETTYIPMVKLKYVLDRIVEAAGSLSGIYGYLVEAFDLLQLIFLNNVALDQLQQNYYDAGQLRYINRMKESIDLNGHVPEMTAKELLLSLTSGFGLWFRTIGTGIHFFQKNAQLGQEPIDWTKLSEPEWGGTMTFPDGFEIKWPANNDRYSDPAQLQHLVKGNGGTPSEMPFSTVTMGQRGNPVVSGQSKMPFFDQAGTSGEIGLGENSFNFRLAFFRGLHDDDEDHRYPLASHDAKDINNSNTGALSLDLNDPIFGLYKNSLKGITDLEADGQPIKVPTRLHIHDILSIRKWENSRRIVALKEGQMNGVIKSVQFKVSTKGIGISIVEYLQQK